MYKIIEKLYTLLISEYRKYVSKVYIGNQRNEALFNSHR